MPRRSRNGIPLRLVTLALLAASMLIAGGQAPPATTAEAPATMEADRRPFARTAAALDLGPAIRFPVGEPTLVVVPLSPDEADEHASPLFAYVVRQADGTSDAFEAVSTHFLCPIRWHNQAQLFIDVCHYFAWDVQGRFAISANGNVWNHERPENFQVTKRDLWHYPAEVNAAGRLVVDFTTHLEGAQRTFACSQRPGDPY